MYIFQTSGAMYAGMPNFVLLIKGIWRIEHDNIGKYSQLQLSAVVICENKFPQSQVVKNDSQRVCERC